MRETRTFTGTVAAIEQAIRAHIESTDPVHVAYQNDEPLYNYDCWPPRRNRAAVLVPVPGIHVVPVEFTYPDCATRPCQRILEATMEATHV